jgi:LysR family transcriptional regulator, hydrogen peroxide-inducible genes activator
VLRLGGWDAAGFFRVTWARACDRVELHQIRYFLSLCETLNFARAAERCGISQPSLTRAVQRLERELGGLLIRREGRLTHLTGLGEIVRPMLAQVILDAENTKTAARRFLNVQNKSLKLGIMPSIGPLRFAPFLARFGAQYPEIAVTLVEGDVGQLQQLLLDGSLEVAVTTRADSVGGRLRPHLLYREPVVVVFPKGHRFERQDAIRLVDLKGEDFVLRSNCDKRALVLETCRERGFELQIVHRSEREDWVQMMVAEGRGVTLMPAYLHLGFATLARPLVEPALDRDVVLLTVAGRPHDRAVHQLVRALRAHRWTDATAAAPPQDGRSAAATGIAAPPPVVAVNS